MRALVPVAIAFSIVLAAVLIMREPRAPSPAQIVARRAAERLVRERVATLGPPRRLEVGASRRGRLAWVAVDVNERGGGAGEPMPRRQTIAWILDDGRWRMMVEHDARVMTKDALRAGSPTGGLPMPAPGGGRRGGDYRSLEKRFRRWLEHPGKARVEDEAIAVGPTEPEFAVGDSATRVLLAAWERDYGALQLEPDDLSVWVSPGGGSGWVAANVEARPPPWGGTPVKLRLTAVYRSRGEDAWGLALAHLSGGAEPDLIAPARP